MLYLAIRGPFILHWMSRIAVFPLELKAEKEKQYGVDLLNSTKLKVKTLLYLIIGLVAKNIISIYVDSQWREISDPEVLNVLKTKCF